MTYGRRVWSLLLALAFLRAVPALSQQPGAVGVLSVSFSGNKALDTRTLRMSIATTQSSWIHRSLVTRWMGLGTAPAFDEREFRRDVLRIQALYGVHGYPDAIVDTVVHRNDGVVSIQFRITEGVPVVVDSVEVTGLPDKVELGEVLRQLPLKKGEPFDRLLFATTASTVEAILHNNGYAFARVTGGFQASADAQSVVVALDATPGPLATISQVDVLGNERVDKRVIVKALSIFPGEVYSDKAIHQSQIDLYRSQMFRQVRISIEDSSNHQMTDSTVNVLAVVRLAEYPLQRARLSAGYGTLDCFRTTNALDLFNFTGGGRRLELRAGLSKIGVASPLNAGLQKGPCPALASEDPSRLRLNYNLSATLHEPLIFSRRIMGETTVFGERHTEYHAYLRQSVGAETAVTDQVGENVPVRLGYSISYGRTVASTATFCSLLNVCGTEDTRLFSANRLRSVLELEASRDVTNSVLDATRGTATALEAKWSPGMLGSDSLMQFTKLSFKFESHQEIGVTSVFSTRLELGAVFGRLVNFAAGPVRYAPPEERFYLGGANSVRGFAANQLGPIVRVATAAGDTLTSALGGNFMAMGSVEGRFPIPVPVKGVSAAVFVDAGQVGSRSTFSLPGFRFTPGVGLRYASLLGPIRLDIGFNPYKVAASALYTETGGELVLTNPAFRPAPKWYDHIRLNLSIGQAF